MYTDISQNKRIENSKPGQCLFTSALVALRQTDRGELQIGVVSLPVIAVDDLEARALALKLALEVFPAVDGWRKHVVDVSAVGNFRAFNPAFG